MSKSIEELAEQFQAFVDEREWNQYHTPQNLAMALSIEANELMEALLWFNNPSSDAIRDDPDVMDAVREELADVVIYALGLANQLDIDLTEAVEAKLQANEERFDEQTAADMAAELDKWQ